MLWNPTRASATPSAESMAMYQVNARLSGSYNDPPKGDSNFPTSAPTQDWVAGSGDNLQLGNHPFSSDEVAQPSMGDTYLYIIDNGGSSDFTPNRMNLLDPATGNTVRTHEFIQGDWYCFPTVTDDYYIYWSFNGSTEAIQCRNKSDGSLASEKTFIENGGVSPILHNDGVFFSTYNQSSPSTIYAWQPDGTIVWTQSINTAVGSGANSMTDSRFDLHAPSDGDTYWFAQADGSVQSLATSVPEQNVVSESRSNLKVSDGDKLFVMSDGRWRRVDAPSATSDWDVAPADTGSRPTSNCLDDTYVYHLRDNNTIYKIQRSDGSVVTTSSSGTPQQMVKCGQYLLASSTSGVYAYDTADLSLVWSLTSLSPGEFAYPLYDDSDGGIYVVDTSTDQDSLQRYS